jgi:PAS domain S-box-containing protein
MEERELSRDDLIRELHQMRDREARYEQVVSMISDILWRYETDQKGSFLDSYISPVADEILGLSPGTIGNSFDAFFSYIHPDDLETVSRTLKEGILAQRKYQRLDYRLIRPDGRLLWVSSRASAERQPSGNIVASGITTDITESRRVQEALRESENRLRTIFETSQSGIILVDREGRITFANQAMASMFNCPLEDLIGSYYPEHVFADEQDEGTILMNKLIDGDIDSVLTERHYVGAGGSDFWGLLSGRRLEDEPGGFLSLVGIITDITERRTARQALQESEHRFRSITEQMNDLIALTDQGGVIKYASPASRSIFALEPDEMLGRHFTSFLHESSIPPATEAFRKAVEEDVKAVSLELTMKRADGSTFPGELNGVKYAYANEPGTLVTIRDVSKRKRAEQEAVKLTKAVEQSPDSIVITDPKGNIEYVNPRFEQITGYRSDEVLGKNPRILQSGKQDKDFYRNLWDTILSGKIWSGEFLNKKKSGEFYWENASISPILDDSGRITHFVAVKEDITERKRLHDELIRSKNYAENLIQTASAIVVALDPEGKVRVFNKAAEKITGYSSEEIKNRNWFSQLVPKDRYPHVWEEFNRLSAGGVPRNFENPILTRDGEERIIMWQNNEILENGRVTGIISFGIDITEMRKYEAELSIAKERAEESDRLKSAFLANMSHEIRTPMNAILGFAELLKEPNLTGEEQEKYIRIIEKSGARMLSVINDIIDISKIESGVMEVYYQKINVHEMVDFVSHFFSAEAEQKGLALVCRNPLGEDRAWIHSDREKLFTILSNLVKNAIKFTSEGSIEFGYESNGHQLDFFVRDTGIGIGPEGLDAIFERFVQAKLNERHTTEGTGLGLAISKAYVQMLGGDIRVESTPGVGSVFYFSIPTNI